MHKHKPLELNEAKKNASYLDMITNALKWHFLVIHSVLLSANVMVNFHPKLRPSTRHAGEN